MQILHAFIAAYFIWWSISLTLSLLLGENIPQSHTADNTDRTMHLSKNQLPFINSKVAFFNGWIAEKFRFNLIINALPLEQNEAWCTVTLLFLESFTKSETDRTLMKIKRSRTFRIQAFSNLCIRKFKCRKCPEW